MGINEYIQIGSKIKKLRKEKNISQKKMAELLGLAHSTYSNYENDLREPNLDVLKKVCKILGVKLNDLLGVDEVLNDADEALLKWDAASKQYDAGVIDRDAYFAVSDEMKEKINKAMSIDSTTLIDHYLNKLNDDGKAQAADLLELLTKIPEYKK
ncbi:helix-turn-helix transcriptional regulator [Acetobacterium wieringae]|uniref:helix-turn-helix domain-containing protein n=1 Tax=Acetobacterium wieringae TaxID=52694 RepID=UPI002B220316|nr:helix-turn-helix transcriptional regulator [Acetobacterium wieringae]MEA4804795.1 helix-turn-helix transcriptional regulator [Acetobacterium wieringae]